MKKATKQKLKVVRSLELHADYYSMVYFGFWLNSDEEELSSYKMHKDENHKKIILMNQKYSDSSCSSTSHDEENMIYDEKKSSDEKDESVAKEWILDIKRQFRLKRNKRNFFKVMLLFFLQMLLLFILLWVINLSKYFNLNPEEAYS